MLRSWLKLEGEVQVKAAGKEMIEAGATRIGTSSSLNILKEFEGE